MIESAFEGTRKESGRDLNDYEEIISGLYLEYATGILRMCYLYLGNRQAAEDAMQETFVKVFRYYDNFQGKSDVKTWITRIAINVCKDMLGRKCAKQAVWMSDDEFTKLLDDKPQNTDRSGFYLVEEKLMLSGAMKRLDEQYREVVVLFYYQELSTKEIAKVLGIARTTVEFRLKKARTLLKKDLEGGKVNGRLEESAGY